MDISFFAALPDALDSLPAGSAAGGGAGFPLAGELLLIGALGLGLMLLLMAAVKLWHTLRQRGGNSATVRSQTGNTSGRRRRRRRNPTLAQAGGLPPLRSQAPLPPSP